ncbi:hypothetical protein GCM10007938_18770 [Vibrio zhanjiangensis]|uniref:DUF1835 domain-containing protein n=1 Tax=Vibrio zhanjiangensis TaxID=1046128 RepID=A0ABQ6EYQ1_9VIBR|nr:DUF1835 domain-containing protein [Vibrio zhanjiangensis]GLT18099.1 hypothetical protein GCM10007938_18770 [Vibrio zhanjiangensis]
MLYRYICWGDSAAGALKQRNKLTSEHHEVYPFFDDLRFGPMEGIEAGTEQRLSWWKTVWQAQWWYEQGDDEAIAESGLTYQSSILEIVKEQIPIVVWVGNTAQDKLMLAMLTYYAEPTMPLFVVDITHKVKGEHLGQYAVAMCEPKELVPLMPKELSGIERTELARLWADWRLLDRGYRGLDDDDKLVQHAETYWDQHLFAKVEQLGKKSVAQVIGEVMGEHKGLIPDSFLCWRLDILRREGKVRYFEVEGPKPQPPLVSMS